MRKFDDLNFILIFISFTVSAHNRENSSESSDSNEGNDLIDSINSNLRKRFQKSKKEGDSVDGKINFRDSRNRNKQDGKSKERKTLKDLRKWMKKNDSSMSSSESNNDNNDDGSTITAEPRTRCPPRGITVPHSYTAAEGPRRTRTVKTKPPTTTLTCESTTISPVTLVQNVTTLLSTTSPPSTPCTTTCFGPNQELDQASCTCLCTFPCDNPYQVPDNNCEYCDCAIKDFDCIGTFEVYDYERCSCNCNLICENTNQEPDYFCSACECPLKEYDCSGYETYIEETCGCYCNIDASFCPIGTVLINKICLYLLNCLL